MARRVEAMGVLISGAGRAGVTTGSPAAPVRVHADHHRAGAGAGHRRCKTRLRGTALDALRRMDALEAVDAASTQMQEGQLVDRDRT
jgi:hypothetical protein